MELFKGALIEADVSSVFGFVIVLWVERCGILCRDRSFLLNPPELLWRNYTNTEEVLLIIDTLLFCKINKMSGTGLLRFASATKGYSIQ